MDWEKCLIVGGFALGVLTYRWIFDRRYRAARLLHELIQETKVRYHPEAFSFGCLMRSKFILKDLNIKHIVIAKTRYEDRNMECVLLRSVDDKIYYATFCKCCGLGCGETLSTNSLEEYEMLHHYNIE